MMQQRRRMSVAGSCVLRGRLAATIGVLLIMAMGPQGARAIVVEAGSFVDKVESLRDLTFDSGSNLYVAPTVGERSNFATLANTLLSGDLVTADAQAAALDYDLVEFNDTDTGNTYIGLTEQLVAMAPTRGWGSYFVNFAAVTNPLVQVPHPRFDTNSWEIGAGLFQQAETLVFMMAGAHRNANGAGTADVAHLGASIFQEVHETWNGPGGENMPWSIHGFNDANHSFPVGSDVILSNGDGSVSAEVVVIDAEFEANGFLTFAYNTLAALDPHNVAVNGAETGTTFSSLGGTTNVQGVHSRGIGGRFIQIEMEQSIRFDAGNRALAATALADAALSTDALATCSIGDADCDGDVDVGDDILPAFSNFTGPGTFASARVEGDVQGDSVGATTMLDPHDGDVDVSDLLTMFGNFTGPLDESGLAAATAVDPSVPDLIYDPVTGEVVLDVDVAGIIGYVLKNGDGTFIAGNHTTILGGVSTSLGNELSEAAFASADGSIGFVFPTGMDLATLTGYLTTNEVSTSLGAPVVPFDLVVLGPAVPEPSTYGLLITGGGLLVVASCYRRRRRRA